MADIKIGRMVLGTVQTNSYFIYDDEQQAELKSAIIIDPADRGAYIFEQMKLNGFSVEGIVLTHGHFDHIMGCNQLREASGAKIYAFEDEKVLCENPDNNISREIGKPYIVVPDFYLKDGDEITIAGITLKLLATPGHTIGSCCYYIKEAGILMSGDTLFQESVGRTDFATGSMSQLKRSIQDKLFSLPGETVVYPGHGDATTIEYEMKYNPFCQ